MVQGLQKTQIQYEQASGANKRIMSSVDFPYYDLDEAMEVAQAILDHCSTTACSRDQLSAWLNHGSAISGSFRGKLSTARLFGLIEISPNTVKLSQLGYNILIPDQERSARVQAFLNVPLYSKLYERLKLRMLPSDIGLESEMVELGVAPKQKAKARQTFKRSAKQAGFLDEGLGRLVMPSGLTPSNENTAHEKTTIRLNPLQVSVPPPQQYDHGGSNSGGGSSGGTQNLQEHLLVKGLFQELTRTDIPWTQAQHDEWLELAKLVLKRIHPISQDQ